MKKYIFSFSNSIFSICIAILFATLLTFVQNVHAYETPLLKLRFEGGAVWQSKNTVQIPNDSSATRFSISDIFGRGTSFSGRLYATLNVSERHGIRLLLAPLSLSSTADLPSAVNFAGATFLPGTPVEAIYKFNSWRIGYSYRFFKGEKWRFWVGVTLKLRDAKVELKQGGSSAIKTDLGFVPLLYLAGDWHFVEKWHAIFEVDALAGGPGRAIDLSVKLGYDIYPNFSTYAGYRMVEGGADVDSVYSFAWLHYMALSLEYRI